LILFPPPKRLRAAAGRWITPLDEHSDALALLAARTSLKLRTRQNVAAERTSGLVSVVMFPVLAAFAPWWHVLAWLLVCAAVLYVSRVTSLRYLDRVDTATPGELAGMERVLFTIVFVSTAAFASGLFWLGDRAVHPDPAFLITVLMLMRLIGVMINNATHPRTVHAAVAVACAASMGYWIRPDPVGLMICVGTVGLAFLMARFASVSRPIFLDSVRVALENAELVRELEAANAAKSRFLAAASHDLRQPIHALVLFSELIGRVPAAELPKVARDIRQSVESLDKLLTGLLDVSRLDAGAIEASASDFALAPWLHGVAADYRQPAANKGLALDVDPPAVWVASDPFLLERVLRNLIDNAIKYTERGRVSISGTSTDGLVRLEVRDTGVGIPAGEIPRIFDEFHQVGNPQRDASRGTGLGLTIVRRLCRILDHPLEVESTLGGGSSFVVTIPRAPERPVQPEVAGPCAFTPPESLAGARILLVEDDAQVRHALEELLVSWGLSVTAVGSLPELERAIGAMPGPPQALIVDYRLEEGRCGLDAIRRVRQAFGAVPAAVFTGEHALALHRDEALRQIPVFQKPVRPEEIGAWIESALEVPAGLNRRP